MAACTFVRGGPFFCCGCGAVRRALRDSVAIGGGRTGLRDAHPICCERGPRRRRVQGGAWGHEYRVVEGAQGARWKVGCRVRFRPVFFVYSFSAPGAGRGRRTPRSYGIAGRGRTWRGGAGGPPRGRRHKTIRIARDGALYICPTHSRDKTRPDTTLTLQHGGRSRARSGAISPLALLPSTCPRLSTRRSNT